MADTQVVVLGGGPGGYAAAFMAADLGLQTTLVNREPNPGGVCLYRGCIPSKAVLHAAKIINEAKEAEHFGLTFGEPKLDLDKLRGWKEQVVNKLTGGLGQMAKQRKVRYIQAEGKFLDAHTLDLGEQGQLTFEHCILASGSRPVVPPMLKLDSPRVMDSTGALELKDIPERLLVVGGGYIGLELGTAYAALGSQVCVVEMTPGLLPGADRDLVKVLQKRVDAVMSKLWFGTKVTALREDGDKIIVSMEAESGPFEESFDRVLISVGRRPNSENLGLENTRVVVNQRGFVEIDSQCRTAEPSIFAIGDVSGDPMLAHRATHQGRLAAEVIHGSKAVFEPVAIPAVVFTDPEIAWVGLTELEAEKQGIKVDVARFPWAASGRALTLNRPDGVTKMVIDPADGRLLGMGIAGVGAGDLIAEGALALELGILAEEVALTIHAHPTLSETVMESADVFFGKSTHIYKPKR